MFIVDSTTNKISLTRGDTAYLEVALVDCQTGEAYSMEDTDMLILSIKKVFSDREYALQKVSIGTNAFHIKPEDTKMLEFAVYKYDVELKKANGDIFTVIGATSRSKAPEFEILPEVGE